MSVKLVLPLAAAALLAGCATPPQVVRSGDPAFANGKTLALAASQATPLDRARPDQASALVMARLGGRTVEPAAADYLMQVAFSELPKGVGVMRDGAGSWLSEARRRFGLRRPAYAVSITAIETRTGRAAFSATATEPAHGDPAKAVDRLVAAALAD
ncbi:MAG: hypothetical protein WA047_00185 [Phenylobacterium sp.]|uniref:hypothetical protein n=1 Tax=Phenylobacterium sp. TaxID=1871053 RepID=UPI003BB6701D